MFLHQLPAFLGENVQVVIEVPKGSGNKFKYDPKTGFFNLHRSLPTGLLFPFDYGFIPSTMGEDGDPLDVLMFIDMPVFAGCIVPGRVIGCIKATQKGEKGGRVDNDILLAVHIESAIWKDIVRIDQLPVELLEQIEFFFTSYRNFQGKEFKAHKRLGPSPAKTLVRKALSDPHKS
jgi:inorganic pyrophosphatase